MPIFLLIFCILTAPVFADNNVAYRFTDTDPEDDVEDEYFDAYGNRIYDHEYRAQHEEQSKELQEEASKPFGLAGSEFGKSWATKPLEEEAKAKKNSPSPSPSPLEEKIMNKPQVLVS